MRCSWTPEKYEKNIRRHGFSFELAEEAFEDPFAVIKEDYIDNNGEMRYQTIAAVEGDLLLISHVYRNIEGKKDPGSFPSERQ